MTRRPCVDRQSSRLAASISETELRLQGRFRRHVLPLSGIRAIEVTDSSALPHLEVHSIHGSTTHSTSIALVDATWEDVAVAIESTLRAERTRYGRVSPET